MKTRKRTESSQGKVKKTKRKSKGEGRSPYTTDERMRAVTGFRQSGMTLGEFCQTWGVAEETMKKWLRAFDEGGESSLAAFSGAGGRPKGSKKPVPAAMKEAVAEAKEKYPFFGVRRVRSWCERFLGIDVPRRTVEETLAEAETTTGKKRKKTRAKKSLRFERARPMQMWQSDITQYVCPRTEKRVFLCVFLDDCTRYVVGWSVSSAQTAELVMQAYDAGVAQYGRPQEVLTDQGRQYASWRGKTDFQKKLKLDGVKHILSRPHHPETLGKCERTVKSSALGRNLPTAFDFSARAKRVCRYLGNPRIKPDFFVPLVLRMSRPLREAGRVIVLVDWTPLGPFQILTAAIGVAGRAVPLYWKVTERKFDDRTSQNDVEELFLLRLQELIPRHYDWLVVLDRGFGRAWDGSSSCGTYFCQAARSCSPLRGSFESGGASATRLIRSSRAGSSGNPDRRTILP